MSTEDREDTFSLQCLLKPQIIAGGPPSNLADGQMIVSLIPEVEGVRDHGRGRSRMTCDRGFRANQEERPA